jgi:hypothetical protein
MSVGDCVNLNVGIDQRGLGLKVGREPDQSHFGVGLGSNLQAEATLVNADIKINTIAHRHAP